MSEQAMDMRVPAETDAAKIARLEFEVARWESWAADLPRIFSFRPAEQDGVITHKLAEIGVAATPVNVAAAWAYSRIHPAGSWNDSKARLVALFNSDGDVRDESKGGSAT